MLDSGVKKKMFFSLIINGLIVILEIVGLYLSVGRLGIKVFQYYTENSNYLALVTSSVFILVVTISLIRGKLIPSWVYILRFVTTASLTITLVVVLLVLIPMMPEDTMFLLFGNSCLYQHTLCPILSILSFIFLENESKLSRKSILYALIPTIIYGVIFITLNILKIVEGPYPFFYFYYFPWYMSVSVIFGIFIGSMIIATLLYVSYNRKKKILITRY
jgi:hypothetical protein